MSTDVAALVSDRLDLWTSAIERRSGAGRGSGKIGHYGIDRLRALILDLAIRGRLAPQDSDAPSGTELLKQIETEKRRLVKSGAAKRMAPIEEPADWPFSIPASWAWSQIGTITNYGETEKANPGDVDDDTWVLELEDVEKGSSRLLERVRHSSRKFQSQKNRFAPQDVIYGKLRPYLDKVLIADESGVCTTEMVPVRGYGYLEPTYLRLFLKSPFFIELADGSTHGMNLPRLGTEKARAAPIALPPLAEQQSIVAKVDELMALCDALETQSASALQAHQILVETLLATLVNATDPADLTRQWARLETHFDKLFTTDASVEALKQTVLELAVAGKLSENSGARPLQALGAYVVEASAGWSPKCTETPRSGDKWGVLKVSAVTWGRYQPQENKELPGSLVPRPEIEVRPGDFLISRANTADLVARSVVVPASAPDRLMMSDKIIRFRFNDEIDPAYVNLVHASPYARLYYARVAGGTSSSMKNVSQSQIRGLQIPVPPLAEQHRVVAKVNELMACCDGLKARLSDAAQTRKQLADAIVEMAAA